MKKFLDKVGRVVCHEGYGLTETSPLTHITSAIFKVHEKLGNIFMQEGKYPNNADNEN
jgi:long-subunit acyl-CoA synthetase (AMP-forming)